ncbi:MAG TPA: polyphenol oxidase family protein [Chthoniobacterales bacterium]|nr:polyphenol oxidase family protein [Chthoniobacterales bacterium]
MTKRLPIETFPALGAVGFCRHAFIERIPGIDVSEDKAEALRRLDAVHSEIRREIGMADWPLLTVEQVHGNKVAVIDGDVRLSKEFSGCDALITNRRQIALGIHVADCCAVYILDPTTPAIGLVHSGKKGTELAIVAKAIEQMRARFGSQPSNLIVQLSPCIRPPHYETDFAAKIIGQCQSCGVRQIFDCSICTACHPDRYYSYRAEKGKTGRMLALLGLKNVRRGLMKANSALSARPGESVRRVR